MTGDTELNRESFLSYPACGIEPADGSDNVRTEGCGFGTFVLEMGDEPEVLESTVGFVVVDVVDFKGSIDRNIIKAITGAVSQIDVYWVNTQRFMDKYGGSAQIRDPTIDDDDAFVNIHVHYSYSFKVNSEEISLQLLFDAFGFNADISKREIVERLNKDTELQIGTVLATELERVDENGKRVMSVFSIKRESIKLANAFSAASDKSCMERYGIHIVDINNFEAKPDKEYEEMNRANVTAGSFASRGSNQYAKANTGGIQMQQMLNQNKVLEGMAAGASTGNSGSGGIDAMGTMMAMSMMNQMQQQQQMQSGFPMGQPTEKCGKCGGNLLFGAKFCPTCGTSTVRTCSSCSKEVPANVAFCPYCGEKLA
ncbi:hypothetical protein McpCs1_08690 [Methanocorpusculaceae archaeon Cs1]|uniref:DZANK-type domain-containing protein n=2 Tax=Methanorbis rubei TaxID=3028300 RepID=A0AAE4MG18_9EURY|nr:hypothetical protein [Methanocorpusculaceae archaeon Cs1]